MADQAEDVQAEKLVGWAKEEAGARILADPYCPGDKAGVWGGADLSERKGHR